MSPAWPLEMLAATTFENIGGTRTKVAIAWQPWDSDEAGHCAFDAARSGMERGFGGTFAKLESYLNSQRAV